MADVPETQVQGITQSQVASLLYRVAGSLDGVTQAPSFSYDPADSVYPEPNDDNEREFEVQSLGIVPAGRLVDIAQGDRYIPRLWMHLPIVGPAGSSVDIIDIETGRVVKNVGSLVGVTSFCKDGIFLQAGNALRFIGASGNGSADPLCISVTTIVPVNASDQAALVEALACAELV